MSTDKSKIITTSQPPDHCVAFKRAAKGAGMTLSEWVGYACLKQIAREERAKLTPRRKPGRNWESAK